MDSAIYRHVMGQIKKSCLLPHNTFPSHNLISLETLLKFSKDWNNVDESEDDCIQFLSSFPCYKPFDYDVQTTSALYCGSGMTDNANRLVKEKADWERQLKNFRIYDIRKAKSCIRDLVKNKQRKLSETVVRFMDHFYKDPEPMFQGGYNWLYTGGNLEAVEHHNQVILFAADYFAEKSVISVLKLNKSLDEVELKSQCQLRQSLPVLQISCKVAGDNLIGLVRQKNNLSLFRINVGDGFSRPEKLWRKKTNQCKLLTFVDVNADCKEVLVSDTNHDIHVFDVEMRKKTFAWPAKMWKPRNQNKDAWNQVLFANSGFYLALRNCFCVIDSREGGAKPQFMFTPTTAVNGCEEICSLTKSACDSNFLYLGTTHNVLQLDVRTGKPVQRWTHLMNNRPQYIASVQNGGEEFVVLQSSRTDESLGITNEYFEDEGGKNFISRSLPCILKGAKESLKLARFNGLCLSPSVAKRFDFAVTGIQCWQNDKGGVHIFTSNSGGDIFLSKIAKKGAGPPEESGSARTEEVLHSMKTYESHLEDFFPRETFESDVELINMKRVLTDLKNSKLKRSKCKKPKIKWKNHEIHAPHSLCFYRDVLAQKILKVWDFEDDELDDTTMSSDAKVREWMEKF